MNFQNKMFENEMKHIFLSMYRDESNYRKYLMKSSSIVVDAMMQTRYGLESAKELIGQQMESLLLEGLATKAFTKILKARQIMLKKQSMVLFMPLLQALMMFLTSEIDCIFTYHDP